MSDFNTLVGELKTYCHAGGDTATLKRCLVQALRELRGQRTEWGEGKFAFVTEKGVAEYPFGAYPRLPGGIMALTATPHCSYSALAGAVLTPDTLLTKTNLTGTIADVQDSAQQPDDDWLDPTTAATWTMEVRWDVALTRPLLPGKFQGAGAQIMRLVMYNEGTNRTVNWKIKEGGSDVVGASGSWTVDSSTPKVYEAKWDAALLSTLNPAANQISLHVTDASSGGDVHIGAVQWFTRTRDDTTGVTGGTQPLTIVSVQKVEELLGGRVEVLTAVPNLVAVFDDRFLFYPPPNGVYRVHGRYQKDATRDEVTNALITTASTTETNEWFRDGYLELSARALEKYYALRPHDAKGAALAKMVAADAERANSLAHEMAVFNRAPAGRL